MKIKSICYVDMDGVLADFFSEYAKLAGIKNGNYRDIPAAKVDPTLDLIKGTDFFARLPKFKTADQLLQIVNRLFGGYDICSSPLRNDGENSEYQKRIWIKKHLYIKPNNVIITGRKSKYAKQSDGTPNVLIDDRGKNIEEWENAGGIGVKYQADEDTLDVVIEGLARAMRILKELDTEEVTTENDDIRDPKAREPFMTSALESAMGGCTSSGAIASATGPLFGTKKKKKVIKR